MSNNRYVTADDRTHGQQLSRCCQLRKIKEITAPDPQRKSFYTSVELVECNLCNKD